MNLQFSNFQTNGRGKPLSEMPVSIVLRLCRGYWCRGKTEAIE